MSRAIMLYCRDSSDRTVTVGNSPWISFDLKEIIPEATLHGEN